MNGSAEESFNVGTLSILSEMVLIVQKNTQEQHTVNTIPRKIHALLRKQLSCITQISFAWLHLLFTPATHSSTYVPAQYTVNVSRQFTSGGWAEVTPQTSAPINLRYMCSTLRGSQRIQYITGRRGCLQNNRKYVCGSFSQQPFEHFNILAHIISVAQLRIIWIFS